MAPSSPKLKKGSGTKKNHKVVVLLRAEVQFMVNLASPKTDRREFQKLGAGVLAAVTASDVEVLTACFDTVEKLCAEESSKEVTALFLLLLRAEGIESVAYCFVEGPKAIREAAEKALASIYRRSSSWLDDVEGVDAGELPDVMFIGHALAAIDEDIAVSCLGAISRLSMNGKDNIFTMLSDRAIPLIHLILTAHRAPELCSDCFCTLFRLCDCPGEVWAQHLIDEKELLLTIVETIDGAPLNMRLQLAGFRLCSLWNQPESFPEQEPPMEYADKEDIVLMKDRVRAYMKEARIMDSFARAMGDMKNGGLHHQCAWFDIIASMSLKESELKSRVDELRVTEFGWSEEDVAGANGDVSGAPPAAGAVGGGSPYA